MTNKILAYSLVAAIVAILIIAVLPAWLIVLLALLAIGFAFWRFG